MSPAFAQNIESARRERASKKSQEGKTDGDLFSFSALLDLNLHLPFVAND
jgi:hypothetical protein